MKLPSWLPLIGAAVGGMALVSAGYGVFQKAGYFGISEARASELILDEAKARERADIKLQLDLAYSELKYLYALPSPSPADLLRRDLLMKQVDVMNARLGELSK